jgi:aspartate aminotransferase-like enzyme
VCALIAGARGWLAIERNTSAPRDSILSLLDLKRDWIDAGRSKLPFYCNEHEMRALQRALAQLGHEQSGSRRRAAPGLAACVLRHRSSRDACRSGLRALGLEPWVDRDQEAAAVATLVAAPAQTSSRELLEQSLAALDGAIPGLLSLAPGPLADAALRINHTGCAAQVAYVCQALTALSTGLRRLGIETDLSTALETAIRTAKPPALPG